MQKASMNRVAALRAARRTLHGLIAGVMLAGAAPAVIAVSVHEVMLLLLLLTPLLLLTLIALGVLDAAAGEQALERDSATKFPQPLELRG